MLDSRIGLWYTGNKKGRAWKMDTKNQKIQSWVGLCLALLEVIKAHGEEGIPSGHLYARLMGKLSLDQYQSAINLLVDSGRITNKGHLLQVVEK
jgi:hypothetical protein